jgi:hypothetical protein
LTTCAPEKPFAEMIVAIGDSLTDIASSNSGECAQDEDDEEPKLGRLSDVDEPAWVICTTSKIVQLHILRFQHMLMYVDKLL